MGGFTEGFKRGMSGEPDGDGAFEMGGSRVVCSHCSGEVFSIDQRLLNSMGMSFVGLDWANREAYVLTCANCSHLEWFTKWPTRV